MFSIDVKFTSSLINNNYAGPEKDLINILVSLVKQYMYRVKCSRQPPNFKNALSNVFEMEAIENCIAKNKGRELQHYKKWHKIIEL